MEVSGHEIALLRLAAQRIVGPGMATPAQAVQWMTAMQAQDYRGALTSVALRTASRSVADVEAALDSGQVVRSWPMRGTLHFVVAEDLYWMLELAAPRMLARSAARRSELGLGQAELERARELTLDALSGGRRLRRKELLAVFSDGGLAPAGGRGTHLLRCLAQTGTICLGPAGGHEQLIVLAGEWIANPRRPEGEEALAGWAERYFASHGPATAKDFGRWIGLAAGEVRTAIELARPRLEHIEAGGSEYLMDPETPELLAAHRDGAREVHLLPGFDEFVLGYADRSAALPPEFADRIVPGANGVFRPTVVSGGQVVGTWARSGRGSKQTIAATPFTSFRREISEAVSERYAALP